MTEKSKVLVVDDMSSTTADVAALVASQPSAPTPVAEVAACRFCGKLVKNPQYSFKENTTAGPVTHVVCSPCVARNFKMKTYTRPVAKVGRNEPCPCKSGKKFKKCCGK